MSDRRFWLTIGLPIIVVVSCLVALVSFYF
jgi:hypothetical protein